LSPILFNILMADLEEKMEKVKWEGVKLGGKRLYSLAYTDDIMLMADKEEEMGSMRGLGRQEREGRKEIKDGKEK